MSETIQDITIEGMCIGFIYRKPQTLYEFLDLIIPTYDFSDSNLRFLYNLLIKSYLNNDVLNDTSITIELSKMNEDEKALFKKLGGINIYHRLANASAVQTNFNNLYNKLKAYNVLRNLDHRGFAVREHIDKLKDKSHDEILKIFESQLMKVGSVVKNINEGERLGNNIVEYYNKLKVQPDVGIPLPFALLTHYLRGLRLSAIGGIGLNSGYGKSRMAVRMLVYTSIINSIPLVVIANEQTIEEWNNMILACVANNVFYKKYNCYIDEDEIARGQCTGIKDKMMLESAQYIQDNSKIMFYETNIFDLSTLAMIIRKFQLRDNANHFIIDTFKPYHSKLSSNMLEWQQYTYTVEQLKEYSRQLKINITFTFQLIDSVLQTGELNSNSISNGKHIYHHMDYVVLGRELTYNEKVNCKVQIDMPNNNFNGSVEEFDLKKDYYVFKIAKNRAGKSNIYIVMRVDRGKIIFTELGYLVKN